MSTTTQILDINPVTGELDLIDTDAEYIRGKEIENTTPSDGDHLEYSSAQNKWLFQSSLSTANIVWTEIPNGLINGVNKTFTLANNVVQNNLMVYLNGILLERVTTPAERNEFSHTANTNIIIMGNAPYGDDIIKVTYNK